MDLPDDLPACASLIGRRFLSPSNTRVQDEVKFANTRRWTTGAAGGQAYWEAAAGRLTPTSWAGDPARVFIPEKAPLWAPLPRLDWPPTLDAARTLASDPEGVLAAEALAWEWEGASRAFRTPEFFRGKFGHERLEETWAPTRIAWRVFGKGWLDYPPEAKSDTHRRTDGLRYVLWRVFQGQEYTLASAETDALGDVFWREMVSGLSSELMRLARLDLAHAHLWAKATQTGRAIEASHSAWGLFRRDAPKRYTERILEGPEVLRTAPVPYAELRDPFRPLLGIWSLGYVLLGVFGGCVVLGARVR